MTPEGSVFVMDTENDRVQQFDLMGTFIRQWGGYGTGDGNLILAWDVSDAPDGSLIISDNTLGMVRRFASDGTYEATLADLPSKPGNLSEDTGGTAVGDDGVVYAADGIGRRVQSWAADGTFLRSYGLDNTTNAGLRYPYDVAVDSAGNVYASDTDRIVVYQPDGRLATSWDIPNPFSHSDALNPITIGPDGAVYVSAWRQDTIYRLRTADREIDEPSAPPATPAPSVAPDPSAGHAGSPMVVHGLAVADTFQVPFTADQPPTWKVNWLSTGGVELAKPDPANSGAIKAAVRVFAPTNAYADACRSANGPVSPPIGPSVDDLVTALTSIPDIRISVPVHDVTIDGHVGKAFDVEAMLRTVRAPTTERRSRCGRMTKMGPRPSPGRAATSTSTSRSSMSTERGCSSRAGRSMTRPSQTSSTPSTCSTPSTSSSPSTRRSRLRHDPPPIPRRPGRLA